MLKTQNSDMPLVLGILGGGQLAKMLALEAYRMGLNLAIIENGANSPAGDMTKLDFSKGWNNREELDKFIDASDVITLENEFIDTDILEYIALKKPVFPSAQTMKLVQDKFKQKQIFAQNNIPVPVFTDIDSVDSAKDFGAKNGFPFLLKTRTLGYDGYGNFTVKSIDDIDLAFAKFSKDGKLKPLLAEKFVSFSKELAVMVARSAKGETKLYPCVETIQKNHICHTVIAPAEIEADLAELAQQIALKCVEAIDGVGVFGVELFLQNDLTLLVNEIAPRPHNSGHYTIEACECSQYENAIRAILGLPLGSSEMRRPAACMINLLGEREGSGVPSDVNAALSISEAKLHLYGKKSSRIGRKMGHITALGNSQAEAIALAKKSADNLNW